jgi:hypothetical protein
LDEINRCIRIANAGFGENFAIAPKNPLNGNIILLSIAGAMARVADNCNNIYPK